MSFGTLSVLLIADPPTMWQFIGEKKCAIAIICDGDLFRFSNEQFVLLHSITIKFSTQNYPNKCKKNVLGNQAPKHSQHSTYSLSLVQLFLRLLQLLVFLLFRLFISFLLLCVTVFFRIVIKYVPRTTFNYVCLCKETNKPHNNNVVTNKTERTGF